MRLRKITTMLLVASALSVATAEAQETDGSAEGTDPTTQGQHRDRDQMGHRRQTMTDEERAARRERFENMSDEEKQAMRQRRQEQHAERRAAKRERWENMSEEERAAARDRKKNRKGGRHSRPPGSDGRGTPEA